MMFFGARIPVEGDAFPAVERFQYIKGRAQILSW